MSRHSTPSVVPQNNRRSAALAIFLFRLALDAEARVRQRVEPVEADLLAALLARAEGLGRAVQAAQRLVHVPEVAPLLRREEERLLALHSIGALIGHMERIAGQVAVGRLQARVEGFAVVAELLHHARALLVQPFLQVLELFLAQALGRLRLRLGAFGRFRRHYRVSPFRPSWRRSAMLTRRPSMSTSLRTSAVSSAVPSTSFLASVSPVT